MKPLTVLSLFDGMSCARQALERVGIPSDSARYKMLGNGWTIEVIAHILSYLK